MDGEGLLEKSNRVFENLLNLTNQELTSRGLTIDPSIIIGKIVSPVQELYIKNLTELLESFLQKNSYF